jgi:hypothetical protein
MSSMGPSRRGPLPSCTSSNTEPEPVRQRGQGAKEPNCCLWEGLTASTARPTPERVERYSPQAPGCAQGDLEIVQSRLGKLVSPRQAAPSRLNGMTSCHRAPRTLMRQHRPNDKAGAGNRELPPMFEGWSEKVGDNRIDEGAVGTPSACAADKGFGWRRGQDGWQSWSLATRRSVYSRRARLTMAATVFLLSFTRVATSR